jgi:hypothetical protein
MAHRFENPFYDGPEFEGLSEDERFDMAKQLRIMARNQRISQRLTDERLARERALPWWMVGFGVAFITAGITMAMTLVHAIHGAFP